MDRADIALSLLQLTGTLKPTAHSSASELEQARVALAQTLLHGVAASQVVTESPVLRAKQSGMHAAVFDETIQSQMQELAANVLAAHKPTQVPAQLAYLTSLSSATTSAPVWAAGMQVERTLVPFEDSGGIPYWLHIFPSPDLSDLPTEIPPIFSVSFR